jgi:hypothetical protein
MVSGSRGGGAGGVAEAAEELSGDGKAPGIPTCGTDADSGTTPPSRLPEPAKPLCGVGT